RHTPRSARARPDSKLILRAGGFRDTPAVAARSRGKPEKFAASLSPAAGTLKKTFVGGCARMDSDAPSVNSPERIQLAQLIECETRAEHWPGSDESHIR